MTYEWSWQGDKLAKPLSNDIGSKVICHMHYIKRLGVSMCVLRPNVCNFLYFKGFIFSNIKYRAAAIVFQVMRDALKKK